MEYKPYLRHVTFHRSRLSPIWIERVKWENSQKRQYLRFDLDLEKVTKDLQEPFSDPTRIDEHFDV